VNRNCSRITHTVESGDCGDGLRRQSSQRAVRSNEDIVRDSNRRVSARSAAEEDGKKLC
jgi:hypothetical protein